MGFVQPTEGYVNFCWLASVAGDKVTGAWFDHIECTSQNFVDQAFQSVLAGARELTLFRLGDVMGDHPGDALLAQRLPELVELADKVAGRPRRGIPFYKPPASDADENLYLADYLAMIGLPILPVADYPEEAQAAFLPVQAAADPGLSDRMRRHLRRGGTLALTPALVRVSGGGIAELAGVECGPEPVPAAASAVRSRGARVELPAPLELDGSLQPVDCEVLVTALVEKRSVPLLTSRAAGAGRVLVLNVRTFAEQDFREVGEWLLSPKLRGLSDLPREAADALRGPLLRPLGWEFSAPAGVALYLFDGAWCVYSFLDRSVGVGINGGRIELAANGWLWQAPPE
jgi:hypothetical protein